MAGPWGCFTAVQLHSKMVFLECFRKWPKNSESKQQPLEQLVFIICPLACLRRSQGWAELTWKRQPYSLNRPLRTLAQPVAPLPPAALRGVPPKGCETHFWQVTSCPGTEADGSFEEEQ